MKCWVGTSGFSYKEWKGSFYPEDLTKAGMLACYSSAYHSNACYSSPWMKPPSTGIDVPVM